MNAATTISTDTMRQRFARVLTEALDRDERVALVLSDIGVSHFNEAALRHPDRIVNVGIREQAQIGVVGGLALAGFRPVAHSYAPFLIERPFEQIKLDLSHQDVGAVLVTIGASYDASLEGRTHQSPGDVVLLSSLSGWTIHVPGHVNEAELLLRSALSETGRVYVRLSEQANRFAVTTDPGRMTRVREGHLATVVAVGPMLDPVLRATETLDVGVAYVSTVRPLDTTTLREALDEPVLVLVEPTLAGTSVAPIAAALADLPHRLLALGVGTEELRRYGTAAEHARAHGLDPEGIRRSIEQFL